MTVKKWICLLIFAGMLLCLLSGCEVEDIPEPKSLRWAFGTDWPQAEDFYPELAAGASVRFTEDSPFPKNMMTKTYTVSLIYTAPKGKSRKMTATLNVTVDKEAPVISGVHVIAVYVGDAVAYRDGVTVTDDCDGKIELEIDSSKVNTDAKGEYPVVYRATDRTGKTAEAETKVNVYDDKITEEMLWEKIDPIIEKQGWAGLSRVDQVQLIWEYVHKKGRIPYTGKSNKGDWIRGAYDALEGNGGDCFSYYALSKAFFVRLGIENLDIFKAPTAGKTNSHYWSMVNIGTSDAPVWYHYDATRVEGQTWDAYLMTDSQIAYLRAERPDLYNTDLSGYPRTATKEMVEID